MEITKALKTLRGKPAHIPNSSRYDLPDFFVQMGYKKGAEIGVFRGGFTEKFCQAGLKIYAIDPWIGYSGSGRSETSQDKQNENFLDAKNKLSRFPNCTIIRKTSMDALKDFKDQSLDFVYIDGDHRFRYIAEDVFEWEKKVRKGGVISGHDYFFTNPKATNLICHVEPVIDAYVKIQGIEYFYTLGSLNPPSKVNRRDRTLSWMWIKE